MNDQDELTKIYGAGGLIDLVKFVKALMKVSSELTATMIPSKITK